ncbi:RnfABCDGE type electron transport complex subunit B [Anaerosporobacter sp.]
MSIEGIIVATLIVSITGLVIGLLLGLAGEKFKVEVDEKELKVRELLPGNNCGGCGFAGCDALAKAIATGEAKSNACPVAGSEKAKLISEIMGVEAEEKEKQVAFVKCAGTCDKTNRKYNYYGIRDCKKVALIPGKGDKLCSYGCMGYGSCVNACAFDAIHIVNGIAVVDKEKCVACGKCIEECPNNLIELVPYKAKHLVRCNSKDKGKDVKLACEAGCIGCMICKKNCKDEAISVVDNIAYIDYNKCTNCGQCAEKCPVKVIV